MPNKTKELVAHIRACPVGFYDGRLLASRTTPATEIEAKLVTWIQRLHELADALV